MLVGRDTAFETTDLNEVAALSRNTLQHHIEAKGGVVEFDHLPIIQAIPLQMEQLFTNLIGNAVKYARKDNPPHIKIEAQQTGSGWKISFSDNGIGFDESYSKKIFEIFQRLHTKSEYEGTGIGLAICKKIVQNHNGNISATSTIGVGTTFTIELPNEN